MERMTKYITDNTKQDVEGCWALVVCPDRLVSVLLAEKLVEEGWNIHKQHMTAKKDGHASLRVMCGTNPEEVWRRMCGMQLNHIFTIGESRSVALTVMAKLRSRQGVVDKGVHYLGEWSPYLIVLEPREY